MESSRIIEHLGCFSLGLLIFGALTLMAKIAFGVPPEEHDWRYLGRAYCHQHGGYWLNLYDRVIKVYNYDKKTARSDAYQSLVWGEELKWEVKMVSGRTGEEKVMHDKTWYWVIPSTQWKHVGGLE